MFLLLNAKCLLNFLPDSSPSPPTEASRPTSGVEQAAGGAEPNAAALRSETADSEEMRESSRSWHSRGRGGSRRASGGEEGSGEDDVYDLMRSIEIGGKGGGQAGTPNRIEDKQNGAGSRRINQS